MWYVKRASIGSEVTGNAGFSKTLNRYVVGGHMKLTRCIAKVTGKGKAFPLKIIETRSEGWNVGLSPLI